MKIAIVQNHPTLGSKDKTLKDLQNQFDLLEDCELVILPELANSGYNFQSKEEALSAAEDLQSSEFVKFLEKQAKHKNIEIIAGINELENDKLYNTAIWVNQNGVQGKYRKLHLFWNEFDFFEPGNLGLPLFNIRGLKVGILICFDWPFTELWRHLALNGAELIVHPSNLVLPYAQQVIPSYSIINRIYIATANRIGTEHGVTFSGGSIISNPKGEVIARAASEKPEIIYAYLDKSLVQDKMITPRNHLFDDRRLDVYSDLKHVKE